MNFHEIMMFIKKFEEKIMQSITIESNQITLPPYVVQQLKGKKVNFIKYQNGFIIKPVPDVIRDAKGFLKNSRFSTERYFQMKQQEKMFENE